MLSPSSMSLRGTLEASHAASPTRPPIKSTARIQNKDLWIGCLAGVAIVSVGAILYFLIKWCLVSRFVWRRRRSQMNKAETESSQWGKIELKRFQLEELGKATENFSRECLVGSGAFGNVYKGTFDEELTLAVKRAHAESYQSVEEFRNEVELLSRVKHRNLVGLIGYCEEAGQKMLVYEYVPNGCLLEYIVVFWCFNSIIIAIKARPSLERGAVQDIVDANLQTEACNMEMMLKMGQLGLRCVVKTPRARPKMTQVVRELEEALRSTTHDRCFSWGTHGTSTDEYVSVEGVGLQRFRVDAEGLSLHSASMRCLDPDSIADAPHGLRGIGEERGACIDG
ncbi:putative LRR receptor-like serine/threonine-protein kinase [Acorus calamus]|uniref:non-specific serine/threonine protein kinase n=1 Tax=Acorus calamus TaxID=4465 RepID=A0AAV9F3D6_ACOCL|nr:putative LRR receptor-like serine/threonine-protein kinase [Acorus calamus]